MHELIKKITDKTGITEQQAAGAVESIKEFVIEKFPMLAGAVENLFGKEDPSGTPQDPLVGSTKE